jgi:hypothetical protein
MLMFAFLKPKNSWQCHPEVATEGSALFSTHKQQILRAQNEVSESSFSAGCQVWCRVSSLHKFRDVILSEASLRMTPQRVYCADFRDTTLGMDLRSDGYRFSKNGSAQIQFNIGAARELINGHKE